MHNDASFHTQDVPVCITHRCYFICRYKGYQTIKQ